MVVDVYQQYFAAEGIFNGRERHGADVKLTADSEQCRIRYEVSVSFFPHDTVDDFSVSYDAFFAETVYDAAGRRSSKRETSLLEELRSTADGLAQKNGGSIDWDHPLKEARKG